MPSALAPVKKPERMVAYEDMRDATNTERVQPARTIRLDLAMDGMKLAIGGMPHGNECEVESGFLKAQDFLGDEAL